MSVSREGNATLSPESDLHYNRLYAGGENALEIVHYQVDEHQCIFDMSFYPFDTQTCEMLFATKV